MISTDLSTSKLCLLSVEFPFFIKMVKTSY